MMKIVKILGGLGNQMFQFALYEALRKRFPEERVLLDLHCFKGYKKHCGFELDKVFGVTYEEASLWDVTKLAYPYFSYPAWRFASRILPIRKTMLKEKPDFTIDTDALTRKGSVYYDGYWQHEEYFKDILKDIVELYRFPEFKDERNMKLAQKLSATHSCAIHIRRGDYMTDPLRAGTIDGAFSERAIKRMKDRINPRMWCVFSDDIAWAKEHMGKSLPADRTVFVDWNQGVESYNDIHLMTLCHHHIIANSTFSWWGARLCQRKDKTIIAPKQWMNMANVCSPVPKDWIVI